MTSSRTIASCRAILSRKVTVLSSISSSSSSSATISPLKESQLTHKFYNCEIQSRYFSNEKAAEKEENVVDEKESIKDEKEEAPEADQRIEDLEKQVSDLKNQVLRALADQENTRAIAKKDVEAARQFAVTSFAKSLLEVSDNLSRAMDAVPEEMRTDKDNNAVLASLFEGIQMTDEGLSKAFKKNGLEKFGEVGNAFDPAFHQALFEYPDPEKEVGSIGQIIKVGFMLHGRPIRAAEVGVVKKE